MTEEPQDEIEQLELLRRIRAQAQVDGSRITLARDVLADAFAADLRGLVDEDWYLDRYPDVADAVGRGMLLRHRVGKLRIGEGGRGNRLPRARRAYRKKYGCQHHFAASHSA